MSVHLMTHFFTNGQFTGDFFKIANAHLNIFESGYGLHSLRVENTLQFHEGSYF